MFILSERLKTIAGLVPIGSKVADVGTDHGYLSVFMAEKGIADFVLATDINEKPLKNAEKTVSQSCRSNIELRLCDGLAGISPDEINCAVIAGMGAEVIVHILSSCEWIKSEKYTLILQPMTSPEILRKYLCDNGFCIYTEKAVAENKKLYSIMAVKYTGEKNHYPDFFYYTGKLDPKDSQSEQYLLKQYRRFKKCADELENSPENRDKFNYNKKIAEQINTYIGENKWH